ncbi:Rep protein [Bacillus mobilis]|uniref:Rep protein n=1 Tax=Bacillus mobilis TaxID=2026190 RepID=UPI0008FDEE8B|nr:Rep protein [Bacillus mobilis]OJE34431.1 Rep protein [Bacillus mobilis]HDR7244759.1 Rep protein [Bacillus mobilis]HDR7946196.1 Rep protein [Bacillus wiedmannii]
MAVLDLKAKLDEVERKAKSRDFANQSESEINEIKASLLEMINELTGEEHYIAKSSDPLKKEPFQQMITKNLQLLVKIDYLTQAEESFLFRVQNFLEFGSNVIICKEDKNKTKKQKKKEQEELGVEVLPKAATITDIAKMIGKSRAQTSEIMNSLRAKEILLNPEGAGLVAENGRTVTPRTWVVNPHIILCAPRGKIDRMTQHLFRYSLKNLKDKNGKKVELPVRFFV